MSAPSSNGGVGFLGLLAIAFIVLKLTGYITWSWWWVTSPLWLPLVVGLVGALVAVLGWVLIMNFYKPKGK